ncbi:MAG: hypothetical protein ACT6QU_14780 [Aliihoeflea sp.]|uniref:hypothetical protein n=1 Tax=Aliihoeflea sp. TaxID=2608088 RepID=UPI0040336C7D
MRKNTYDGLRLGQLLEIENGYTTVLENGYGDTKVFRLLGVIDEGDQGQFMVADVDGEEVTEYFPVPRGGEDGEPQSPHIFDAGDNFFGDALFEAFIMSEEQSREALKIEDS